MNSKQISNIRAAQDQAAMSAYHSDVVFTRLDIGQEDKRIFVATEYKGSGIMLEKTKERMARRVFKTMV